MNYDERFPKTEISQLMDTMRDMVNKAHRPANEVVMNEEELCALLKVSKRWAQQMRQSRKIKYSKRGGKIFYLLSNVLHFIKESECND